jgi:nicotinamidase/pyrazinamidase
MAGYYHEGSPLLEEWLTLAAAPTPVAATFGANDAVVIIDMQADFAPKSPTNPHGGRLGSPEAENIVPLISAMTDAVLVAGGSVAATRDYHTIDHASFLPQGGMFPPHCVQGSPGSKFLPASTRILEFEPPRVRTSES